MPSLSKFAPLLAVALSASMPLVAAQAQRTKSFDQIQPYTYTPILSLCGSVLTADQIAEPAALIRLPVDDETIAKGLTKDGLCGKKYLVWASQFGKGHVGTSVMGIIADLCDSADANCQIAGTKTVLDGVGGKDTRVAWQRINA